jgi:hypothetical protein
MVQVSLRLCPQGGKRYSRIRVTSRLLMRQEYRWALSLHQRTFIHQWRCPCLRSLKIWTIQKRRWQTKKTRAHSLLLRFHLWKYHSKNRKWGHQIVFRDLLSWSRSRKASPVSEVASARARDRAKATCKDLRRTPHFHHKSHYQLHSQSKRVNISRLKSLTFRYLPL